MDKWQLQDAKNRFSEVVKKAQQNGPQIVTRHGIEAVVVISVDEYRRLLQPQTDLLSFFRKSPLYDIQIDLSRQKDQPREVVI
jgi:prevent-host-death family protein